MYSVVYNCRRPTPCKTTQNNEEKSRFFMFYLHNVSDVDRQNAERKLTNLSQTSYVFIFLVFKLSCCLSPWQKKQQFSLNFDRTYVSLFQASSSWQLASGSIMLIPIALYWRNMHSFSFRIHLTLNWQFWKMIQNRNCVLTKFICKTVAFFHRIARYRGKDFKNQL